MLSKAYIGKQTSQTACRYHDHRICQCVSDYTCIDQCSSPSSCSLVNVQAYALRHRTQTVNESYVFRVYELFVCCCFLQTILKE